MNNSELSSPMLSNKTNLWAYAAFLLLFLGFLDATYLTISHFNGANLQCVIAKGCDVVTTSKYAKIGPIPISMIGSVYYLIVFLLILGSKVLDQPKLMRLALYTVLAGFLVSLSLVYLQIFVIKALCIYCLTSAGITTLVLGILFKLNKLNKESI